MPLGAQLEERPLEPTLAEGMMHLNPRKMHPRWHLAVSLSLPRSDSPSPPNKFVLSGGDQLARPEVNARSRALVIKVVAETFKA